MKGGSDSDGFSLEFIDLVSVLRFALFADDGGRQGCSDEPDTDQSGDDLGYLVLDGQQEQYGQGTARPLCSVLEVDVLAQGALADQEHRQGPDVHRADPEADPDDDR